MTVILMFSLGQTDEQAPLPGALSQLLTRVSTGLQSGRPADFVFNCQMGRGRTTSGMITACLIATTMTWEHEKEETLQEDEDRSANTLEQYDSIDGPSEEEAYLQGEWGSASARSYRDGHHDTLGGSVDSADCGQLRLVLCCGFPQTAAGYRMLYLSLDAWLICSNPVLTCHPSRTGEYKVILQLVSVLSHGKLAKRLTDRAIDQMQDVQNLRKAIYECVQLLSDLSLSAGRGNDFVEVIQEHCADRWFVFQI